MENPVEVNRAILAMLEAAQKLLQEAVSLHGQHLFYDSDGNVVEVEEAVQEAIQYYKDGCPVCANPEVLKGLGDE